MPIPPGAFPTSKDCRRNCPFLYNTVSYPSNIFQSVCWVPSSLLVQDANFVHGNLTKRDEYPLTLFVRGRTPFKLTVERLKPSNRVTNSDEELCLGKERSIIVQNMVLRNFSWGLYCHEQHALWETRIQAPTISTICFKKHVLYILVCNHPSEVPDTIDEWDYPVDSP